MVYSIAYLIMGIITYVLIKDEGLDKTAVGLSLLWWLFWMIVGWEKTKRYVKQKRR